MDLVAISQSSPGPLAINASILVGYRMAGVVGALITILATALPPLVIITIVSYFYEAFRSSPIVDAALKGMQAGVSAVILNVIYTMAGNVIKQRDALAIGIMVAAFAATYIFKINVMFVVLACAALGVALSLSRKPGKGNKMVLLKLFWSLSRLACSASGRLRRPAVDPAAGGGYPRLADHDQILPMSSPFAEMTPGSISINSATFVGTKIAGMPGRSSPPSAVCCPPLSLC